MQKIMTLIFFRAGFDFLKKNQSIIYLTFLLGVFPSLLFSQEKIIDKANTAYKYKQYAQAAKLYEIVIAEKEVGEKKSGLLNLKTKLVNCYRMNNRMEKAETIYAEVVQNDRAKYKTYLYYGETLMSNGKYNEAKKWFLKYQQLEPDDGQGAIMAANCDKVKLIQPYFPIVEIEPFAHNSDADDNAPVLWENGLVFSSDRKQGVKLMKEKSGWTGRDYLDLYFSAINEDSIYQAPKRFSGRLNEVNKNTGNASFSANGKEVYFTRNDNVLDKSGTYNLQLFKAQNNGNGKWKKVEKLSFCSSNSLYMHPAISPDGKELYFTTNRKGEGGTDIWVSKRNGDKWGKPTNLGPTINTSTNEGFPFMDKNGRLYFCSKGHPTYGGFDIFFSERDQHGNWQIPRNLGKPINSSLDDISIYIDANGKSGMFSSSRKGGDDDIYFFKVLDKIPEQEPLADASSMINKAPSSPFVNRKPGDSPQQSTVGSEQLEDVAPKLTQEGENKKIEGKNDVVLKEEKLNILPKNKNELNRNIDLAGKEILENNKSINNNAELNNTEKLKTGINNKNETPLFSEIKNKESGGIPSGKKVDKEDLIIETGDKIPQFPNSETLTKSDKKEAITPGVKKEKIKEKPDLKKGLKNKNITKNNSGDKLNIEENKKTEKNNSLLSFQQLIDRANSNELNSGEIYRIDGATFDENVWQLTPRVAKKLNSLVTVLRKHPEMEIEISAHTETLGLADKNLELSKNRVNMVVEYILREGIDKKRIKGVGYGETQPLNHCRDGVTCSMDEHHFNQRFEVKIKL